MKIGFLGISHLSINHGAAFLEKGFDVIFFDQDPNLVKALNACSLDYSEPGLLDTLKKNRDRFDSSYSSGCLSECDLLYVARDVSTNDQGKSDLTGTFELFEIAKKSAHASASIVILCQVPPGFCRELDFPKDRLFYQVETLIFGQALDRALCPERYIVGLSDPHQNIDPALKKILESFDCPIIKMRYESAELAKISINLFLISSVSTTNTIADICEKVGADWFEIKESLQLDKRIGKHAYLNPGLGLSGGNLERDLATALNLSYEHGSQGTMVQAWISDSSYRKSWVLKTLHQKIFPKNPHPKIGILGIAYKPNTSSTKNSPSLLLMECLKEYDVCAFDPVVKKCPIGSVKITNTIEQVLECDVLIIMTPWEEFKSIDYKALGHVRVLIDPFNFLSLESLEKSGLPLKYHCIGRNY
ncbi:GDP-mannose dehydrogenase [Alphaproteobacteria bacterium]|nr:GDP-mannose dehydrogenase [Alphaproteobacteria bacterium]